MDNRAFERVDCVAVRWTVGSMKASLQVLERQNQLSRKDNNHNGDQCQQSNRQVGEGSG
jgi:hypothetical protein